MAGKKVVVAGATGLVGNAALRHFERVGGAEVVALSRRRPRELHGAGHVPIDLLDAAQCGQVSDAYSTSCTPEDASPMVMSPSSAKAAPGRPATGPAAQAVTRKRRRERNKTHSL